MPDDRRVSISSSSNISADAVAKQGFAVTRKGFDPSAVRAFLDQVGRELAAAEDREKELREALAEAERRIANPVVDEETLTTALGHETARVLRSAHDAASELLARAESDSSRARNHALAEAEQLQSEAEQIAIELRTQADREVSETRRIATVEAEALRSDARLESDALIAQTRAECRAMVQEAQELRTRVLGDLSRRRRALHSQIEQLRAGRERFAETFREVRVSVDLIADEIFRAEEDARLAAEAAGREFAEHGEEHDDELGNLTYQTDLESAQLPPSSRTPGTLQAKIDYQDEFTDGPARSEQVQTPVRPSKTEHSPKADQPANTDQPAKAEASAPQSGASALPETAAKSVAAGAASVATDPTPAAKPAVKPASPPGTPSASKVDPHTKPAAVKTVAGNQAKVQDEEKSGKTESSPIVQNVISGSSGSDAITETSQKASVEELFARIRAGTESTTATSPMRTTTPPEATDPATAKQSSAPTDSAAVYDQESERQNPMSPIIGGDVPPIKILPPVSGGSPSMRVLSSQSATATQQDPENTDNSAADALTDPDADASPELDDVEGDLDPALLRRDELLGPVVANLARRLKRALQDDQNDILDRLRSSGSWDPSVLEEEPIHRQRYVKAANEHLAEAARAGAVFGGGAATDAPQITEIAEQLAASVVGPLRNKLDPDDRSGSSDDPTWFTEHVGATFREWKGARVERLAGDQAVSAFCKAILEVGPKAAQLQWVVDDDGVECPDCEDNELAGPVKKGDEFPTGHTHPPAHAGCRCLLVPVNA